MPVYEFRCPSCGKVFERKRPREKAGTGARCPDDGKKANRVFGAAIIGVSGGDDAFGDLSATLAACPTWVEGCRAWVEGCRAWAAACRAWRDSTWAVASASSG